jgi:hypothetical protein
VELDRIEDAAAAVDVVVDACRAAGSAVVAAALNGPALRAELGSTEDLVAVAQAVPVSVLYVDRRIWDGEHRERYTARLAAAHEVLQTAPDEDVDPSQYAALRASAESLAVAAQQQLTSARSDGAVIGADLALVAGGVVHDLSMSAAWFSDLDDAFNDLDDAVELLQDPDEALSEGDMEARWAQRDAERQAELEAERQALAELGRTLQQRLVDDAAFQGTTASDRRWTYAKRVLADEYGRAELSQPERGALRAYVDAAWEEIQTVLLPRLRQKLLAEMPALIGEVQAASSWQASPTLKMKARVVRERLQAEHPLLATSAMVDEVLVAMAGAERQQQSLL